jgi:hypothetical protein
MMISREINYLQKGDIVDRDIASNKSRFSGTGSAGVLRPNHLFPPLDKPEGEARAAWSYQPDRVHDGGRGLRSFVSGALTPFLKVCSVLR